MSLIGSAVSLSNVTIIRIQLIHVLIAYQCESQHQTGDRSCFSVRDTVFV